MDSLLKLVTAYTEELDLSIPLYGFSLGIADVAKQTWENFQFHCMDS
jgi:hypothetical protein